MEEVFEGVTNGDVVAAEERSVFNEVVAEVEFVHGGREEEFVGQEVGQIVARNGVETGALVSGVVVNPVTDVCSEGDTVVPVLVT